MGYIIIVIALAVIWTKDNEATVLNAALSIIVVAFFYSWETS